MSKAAIAIAAHPDDIEFLMAGTLIRLADVGYDIHYLNVANGCCGTVQYDRETIIRMRREEAKQAADSIGAVFHESLCNDIEIFYDRETLTRLTSIVRDVAPDIVLTHSPIDYMEDHTNTCRLAVTATFCRGMPNFPVDPPREAISQSVTLYHAQPYPNHDPLGNVVRPVLFVVVSDVIENKVAMLSCHKSQKNWLDESQGHDSYLKTLRDLDAEVGRMSGRFEYAEGWRRHLHVGFCGADDDPLLQALDQHIHQRET
jgi:LmbE family N-acetylglucosaminyl deacetylase